jgi:hypothetical protein
VRVRPGWLFPVVCVCALALAPTRPLAVTPAAQDTGGKGVYDQLKAFALTGGTAKVDQLVLKRDRVEMTLTGQLFFAAPVNGKVHGAVFIGDGTLRAAPPPSDFEKDNLRRILNADTVDSDFRTAVLRWTDDTFERLSASRAEGTASPQAQRLATEADAKFTLETGANLAARLATSLLNDEKPGVFAAHFDGGRRGKFTYLLDSQGRIPLSAFGLNGGEKGVIFAWQSAFYFNEVWMAFYSEDDYARSAVEYSDTHDQIDVLNYALTVDLRNLTKVMGLTGRIEATARGAGLRAVQFKIGEALSNSQEDRLKRQLRLKSASVGGSPVPFVQEDWEGGFTLFLPQPTTAGQPLPIDVAFEGDFVAEEPLVPEVFYPLSNDTWLPRHGYLDRATFDLTFRHRKREKVAAIGTRVSEGPDPQDPQAMVTRYVMKQPVALALFAAGPFDRKVQQVTWESGRPAIPVEFNTVPSRVAAIKHEFILAELDNAVRYFAAFFGSYPYDSFGATFHPYPFGQGFASMLVIPPTDRESAATHAFIAHETSHQWWGNIVAWRSYRDQWLSEGFAEYSGMLYAVKRDREGPKALSDMLKQMREALLNPPRTALGVGRGRLNDIGPIVLGRRLHTTKTLGAYQALIYEKGALVLRMLHFLMSDPSNMNDAAFVAMMKDFVEKHRNGAATTEDFRQVASRHFAGTPTARKFGLRDLDWFFRQWVYGTHLPTYTLEYELKPNADGSVNLAGVVKQDNAGPDWMMILPVVLSFDNNQEARTTVRAQGPSAAFELKLPARPRKVELDPGMWVLSEKTITKGK